MFFIVIIFQNRFVSINNSRVELYDIGEPLSTTDKQIYNDDGKSFTDITLYYQHYVEPFDNAEGIVKVCYCLV